ncbi:MAG: DUF4097 family beta strand repeat protein [Solobacterium sp.]|nr:DUF4097 family beta strand repeat protein [Solobacterium sp.]
MERIREILENCFSEYVMSDELTNLKEEILANATDHYYDLLAHNESEEEAEKTVIASLGDLRALLRELGAQKKKPDTGKFDPFGSDVFRGLTDPVGNLFSNLFQEPAGTQEIKEVFADIEACDIRGISMNIHIASSSDSLLHTRAAGNLERLTLHSDSGTLYIEERSSGKLFQSGIDLWLELPKQMNAMDVHVISGDLLAEELSLDSFRFQSVSGDLDLKHGSIGDLAMKTTSGDLTLHLNQARRLYAETISGDVTLRFRHGGEIAVSSLSGDIDAIITAGFESIRIKTRSGDVSVKPGSAHPVKTDLATISGSLENSVVSIDEGKEISVRTISGDILLH